MDVVTSARTTPFAWGDHDCFLFACDGVRALVGEDVAWPWRGHYRDRRRALGMIAAYGATWEGAFSRLFGAAPVPMPRARRGDVADYVRDGVHHLGIVFGPNVALLAEKGLHFESTAACLHAWRIG